MNELVEEIYRYLRLVSSRRKLVPISAALVCIIGWAVVAFLPNKFTVRSILQVERSSILQPLLKGITVETDIAIEMAGLMRQMMLVPKNLELIAHDAGLDKLADTPEELDKLVAKLETSIDISAIEDKRGIYMVTYSDSNAQTAQKVVESLIKRFVDSIIATIRADSEEARRILDQQIAEYRIKLDESALKLKTFKQQHIDLISEDGRTYYSRLQDAKNQYEEALLSLHEAEEEVQAIRIQPAPSEYLYGRGNHSTGMIDPDQAELDKAESELADLQLKYTEQHPDVIARKKTIEQLRLKKNQHVRRDSAKEHHDETESARTAANPGYQTWKTFLTRAEAKVAALRSRSLEYKRRLDELERGIVTMPQLEAELAGINREYIIIEDSYQKLVARREAATISEKIEKASDIKINMLEPPRVPTRPVGPKRILLNTAVLVAGLTLGIGIPILIGLISPVVYTRQDLRKLTDIPILGSVSLDRSLISPVSYRPYFAAFAALLLAFGLLNLLYFLKFPPLAHLAGSFLTHF